MSHMTLCNEARDTLMKLAVSRFVTSYVTLCNALCHTVQRNMSHVATRHGRKSCTLGNATLANQSVGYYHRAMSV